jgi:hypothetical protein
VLNLREVLHLEFFRQKGILSRHEISADERILHEPDQNCITLGTDNLVRRCHDFLGLGNALLSLKGMDIHFICKNKVDDVGAIFTIVSLFAGAVLLCNRPRTK